MISTSAKRLTFSVVLLILAAMFLVAASLTYSSRPAFAGHLVGVDECGTPTVVTLLAGQTIDAGTVTIANDDINLYVTFSTTSPWLLSETHVHVGDSLEDIPQTKKGNPKVGRFDYQTEHDPVVNEFTYVIPLAGFDDVIVVAAHAVVVQFDGGGNVVEEETG